MLYHLYDLQYAMSIPARSAAHFTRMAFENPFNPLSHTHLGRTMAANATVYERATRRFGEPDFGLDSTSVDEKDIPIKEEIVLEKPFCNLLRFKKEAKRKDPKVLLVAPMSGHYATLLRGTVEALLPHHDVYITDWIDARQVPLSEGRFDLDTNIAYLQEFIQKLGPDVHVIAVCQPAPATLAAISLMATNNDPCQPMTMTLMGGPIDTRVSKTTVTQLAEDRPISWFDHSVCHTVPFYYPGGLRKVYPGFIQLSGFMSMNLDRHVGSHMNFYKHLIQGDGESADHHKRFYNEYLAVMDITAEFYLQTVETVFQKHSLPKGEMVWTDPVTGKKHAVRPQDIRKTALLTIEGELDDISATGQTTAAHQLCSNLDSAMHYNYLQKDVGHYGIFNGRKWRSFIMPRIRHFIRRYDKLADPVPKSDYFNVPDLKPHHWQPKNVAYLKTV